VDSDSDRLARLLFAIDDAELRVRKAAALLSALPADRGAEALGELVRGAAQGRREHAAALEAALRAVRELLDPSLLADLRLAAEGLGERDALGLLSARPPMRVLDKGEPGYVDREMNARTLGHRKALARGQDADLLSRLAHDQDPSVLANLLENPRLTEREVLIAASRRPTGAAVLEVVFRSRRWRTNRRVRKALALNPYSPPALAASALSLLPAPDLREVARDTHLRAEVREHARRLLELRKGRDGETGT
jgi:hypothetical protein